MKKAQRRSSGTTARRAQRVVKHSAAKRTRRGPLAGARRTAADPARLVAALRASEERLRLLVEQASEGVFLADRDGRFIEASLRGCQLFGYTHEEFLKLTIPDVHPSESAAGVQVSMARVLAGETLAVVFQFKRKDGSLFVGELGATLLSGGRMHGIVRDITERQRADDALRASQISLELAQAAAKLGSWELDLKTGRGEWSTQMFRLFDREPTLAAPTLSEFPELLHPDDDGRIVELTRRCAEEAETFSTEFRTNPARGPVRHLFGTIHPVRDAEGHVVRVAGTVQDISERAHADEALRESAERLRLAVQASNVGLWDWDLRTDQVVFSREWKRQLGYEEHEIANEFGEWERRVHPDDLAPTMERVQSALARPQSAHNVEFRMRHKDGSWRWIYTRGEVLCGPDGAPVRMLGCHLDITERKQAEEELRASETRFRQLIEHAPDAIVLMDLATGLFLQANPAAERLFKLPASELCRVGPPQMSPPFQPDGRPSLEKVGEFLARVVAGESPVFEWMHRDAEGHDILCEVRLLRMQIGGRAVVRGSMADIGERKRSEALLGGQKRVLELIACGVPLPETLTALLEAVEGHSPDMLCSVLLLDPTGSRLRHGAAPRLPAEYTGAIDGVAIGPNVGSCGTAAFRAEAVLVEDIASDPLWKDFRELALRHGLRACWSTPIFDARQRVLGTFAIYYRRPGLPPAEHRRLIELATQTAAIAISHQQAERQMRESEARYRSLFDRNLAGVFRTTAEGRIVECNDAFVRIFGYSSRDELLGASTTTLYAAPARRGALLEHLRAVRILVDQEFEGRRKDGGTVWLLVNAHLVTEGAAAGEEIIEGTLMDITARRMLETQLRQSQQLEAIGRLAGGVAHDFNNILGIITGHGELALRQLGPDHPLRARIGQILKAGDRAAGLTRQLLAFSRKQVMQPRALDLGVIVADAERMLAPLIGEDIAVVAHTEPGLGTVRADPSQIEQIVLNLAVNARDAMPKGGSLTISTANVDLDQDYAAAHPPSIPGRYVMLAVADTGAGIDEETQRRIFEPFFTTKSQGGGTGLGLATVYGIVKQSGGYIWVESELGRGTTFKVYLPRIEERAAVSAPAGPPGEMPGGHETILLVEDTKMLQLVIRETLAESGYTVLVASNGEEALALARARKGPIELLFTDVVMPKLGGQDLAKLLGALRPEMRVLYMSGYTGGAISHHGVLDPGVVLLEKPFTADKLARAVREALDRPR